jgi:hypothetical protein
MDSVTSGDIPMTVQPEVVLSVITVLTQPITKGHIEHCEKGHVISFENILIASLTNLEKNLAEEKNLEAIASRFSLPKEDDIHWKFVMVCLELLKLLNDSMEEAVKAFNSSVTEYEDVASDRKCFPKSKQNQAPPDVLSVGQQKTVSTVLQFVVLLGMSPCLSPGVGMPVEFRSGFGRHLKSCKRIIDVVEKIERLSMCVDILLDCVRQPSLSSLVLTLHLNDLVAALLQLCYGYGHHRKVKQKDKTKRAREESIDIDCRLRDIDLTIASPGTVVSALQARCRDPGPGNLDGAVNENKSPDSSSVSCDESLSSIHQQKYEKCLNDLLQQIYPPMLVRALVMLQGGPKRPPKKVIFCIYPVAHRKAKIVTKFL